MRFLFKPGWLAFIALVIGFSVACYTLLAPWQFRRNAEREQDNAAIAASMATPPVPLAQLIPAGAAPSPAVEWRRAVVRGRYVEGAEVVVRLRSVATRPAYEVLAAFRTDDGRTIAVNRGYLRPGPDNRVAGYPPPPAGDVQLTGRIRLDENDPGQRPPLVDGGVRQVYASDSRQLAAVTGQQVAPGYLALLEAQPGALTEVPLPDTDAGPFWSYAWQWLTFGAMALFGLVYFIRLELLQRRGAGPPRDDDQVEADPLAQRYGNSGARRA
ncbi:MAG: SURF1 family cytochrome oxidase biogenesis protein [Pseudonocardia sp.]